MLDNGIARKKVLAMCHNNNNNDNELFSRIVFAAFALIIIVVIYYQACQRVVQSCIKVCFGDIMLRMTSSFSL